MSARTSLFSFALLGLVALGNAVPALSSDAVQTVHAALNDSAQGKRPKAMAILESVLMTRGVTVGMEATGAMTPAVEEGIARWETRLSERPFRFVGTDKADVTVRFVSEIQNEGDVMGRVTASRQIGWDSRSHDYKVRGTILVRDNVEGRPLRSDEVSAIVSHELGHLLGLADDSDRNHLMGPFIPGRPLDRPTDEEVETVRTYRSAVRQALASVSRPSDEASRGVAKRGHRVRYRARRQG